MPALKFNGEAGKIDISPTWKWLAGTVIVVCIGGAGFFFRTVANDLEKIREAMNEIAVDLREVKTDLRWIKSEITENEDEIRNNRQRIRQLEQQKH